MKVVLFDTHCHIQFLPYKDDQHEVIERCKQKNVVMNVVGTHTSSSKKAIALAERFDDVYASVGIHPIQHDVVDVEEEMSSFISRGEQWNAEEFEKMARHPKVIAIGETGLDRHHIRKDVEINEIFEKQKKLFLEHYALAKKVGKPLVIHVREAHNEIIEILTELTIGHEKMNGVIHCFTGTSTHAQAYISFGLYLGFTGVITYPPRKGDPNTAYMLEETIRNIPLDRILVETDSPYLAPQVVRGQRNEPWRVEECIKKIALVRGLSFNEVAHATHENATRLFHI